MKKLIIIASIFLTFTACEKKVANSQLDLTTKSQTTHTVKTNNGTLCFNSVEEYKNFLGYSREERSKWLMEFSKNPEFNMKVKRTSMLFKSMNSDSCDEHNPLLDSILDINNMIIIEDFLLKLDFCNDSIYVSDNLSPGAYERRLALINGQYSSSGLIKFSFLQPVDDELHILRDSLNGNISARSLVCNQVAISDRTDTKSSSTQNGINFPSYTLKYNNLGISGSIKVFYADNPSLPALDCFVLEAHYRPRCEAEVNKPAHTLSIGLNSSTRECYIHNGTRLTNFPTSTNFAIRVQLRKTLSGGGQAFSSQANIIP